MMIYVFDRVENIVETGDASYQHFLLFLHFLTLSQISPGFMCLQYKPFEKPVGKGEIARNEQFLFFPQCFLSI